MWDLIVSVPDDCLYFYLDFPVPYSRAQYHMNSYISDLDTRTVSLTASRSVTACVKSLLVIVRF